MATAEQQAAPPLNQGDNLTRAEFLRRWEAMPHVLRAELIGGVVFMPSPLSWDHGSVDNRVSTWLGVYGAYTPGCDPMNNVTWLMGEEDSPQPDMCMRILPEFGGRSRMQGRYPHGVPEFLAEICVSNAAYDLHQKLELYQAEGVEEYLAVLVFEQELRWHRLVNGVYQLQPAPADGIWRCQIFPGLWLNGPALLQANMVQVLATLTAGLNSPEHAAFVEQLARQRRT
jgi:Uma2 family endonuclease